MQWVKAGKMFMSTTTLDFSSQWHHEGKPRFCKPLSKWVWKLNLVCCCNTYLCFRTSLILFVFLYKSLLYVWVKGIKRCSEYFSGYNECCMIFWLYDCLKTDQQIFISSERVQSSFSLCCLRLRPTCRLSACTLLAFAWVKNHCATPVYYNYSGTR